MIKINQVLLLWHWSLVFHADHYLFIPFSLITISLISTLNSQLSSHGTTLTLSLKKILIFIALCLYQFIFSIFSSLVSSRLQSSDCLVTSVGQFNLFSTVTHGSFFFFPFICGLKRLTRAIRQFTQFENRLLHIGYLRQIILNKALVHKFHDLTSGLVVGTDLITIMTAI